MAGPVTDAARARLGGRLDEPTGQGVSGTVLLAEARIPVRQAPPSKDFRPGRAQDGRDTVEA